MRKSAWFMVLVAIFAASSCVLSGETKKETFFDLYSLEYPDDWQVQRSINEFAATFTLPDTAGMILVLPPIPAAGRSLEDYAELYLDDYAKGIGTDTWGVISQNTNDTYLGYPNFMIMVGFPEEGPKLIGLVNVFDVQGFQVMQFAFVGADKIDTYMKPMAEVLDTYTIDEDAMKKMEFTLKKKGEFLIKKFGGDDK